MAIPAAAFVLTAGTADLAGIYAALITHFGTSSSFFNLIDSDTDAGLVVEPTAALTSNYDLSLRRTSTTSGRILLDPDKTITVAGNTGAAPTWTPGANDSGEQTFTLPGGLSTTFYLVEYEDAFTIICLDAAKTYFPYVIHAGLVFSPAWASDVSNGIEGYGFFLGQAAYTSSTTSTYMISQGATSSFIKCGDTWYARPFALLSAASTLSSRINSNTLQMVRPIAIAAYQVSGDSGDNMYVGNTKYMGVFPDEDRQVSRVRAEAANDAWIFGSHNATSNSTVFLWEHGVAAT